MATIRKRSGNWTVSIRKKGYDPLYGTFDTKAEAEAWAAEIESSMRKRSFIDTSAADQNTLRDILERYSKEISTTKKGVVQEQSKIKMICKHDIVDKTLSTLTSSDVAGYRDDRLKGYGEVKKVGEKTTREELNLINHALKIANAEWHITLPRGNPAADVRKPSGSKGKRDRRLKLNKNKKRCEYSRLILSAKKIDNKIESAIILAIETAMRRTELATLTWSNVNLRKRIAYLDETKNGDSRDVPLSTTAVNLLKELKKQNKDLDQTVLAMSPDFITHTFIKVCKDANIVDFHWHDLRHEATSRLFELGLNEMEVSTITGHKTLQMLKRYTHLKASDLVKKLK